MIRLLSEMLYAYHGYEVSYPELPDFISKALSLELAAFTEDYKENIEENLDSERPHGGSS